MPTLMRQYQRQRIRASKATCVRGHGNPDNGNSQSHGKVVYWLLRPSAPWVRMREAVRRRGTLQAKRRGQGYKTAKPTRGRETARSARHNVAATKNKNKNNLQRGREEAEARQGVGTHVVALYLDPMHTSA